MIAIDLGWSFADVLAAAAGAHVGRGVQSTGRRLEILRAWGSVVGRVRATAELERFRQQFPKKRAASGAAGFSDRTFRQLEVYYRDLHQHGSSGLTLTFDTRLHRFDATAFDALIAGVLGPETDVTIEARSNIEVPGPAFIRINGSRPSDLVAVAEAFYDRVWASSVSTEDGALRRTMTAIEMLFGPRLEELRDALSSVDASTSLFADEDVRQAITDKVGEHVDHDALRNDVFHSLDYSPPENPA